MKLLDQYIDKNRAFYLGFSRMNNAYFLWNEIDGNQDNLRIFQDKKEARFSFDDSVTFYKLVTRKEG